MHISTALTLLRLLRHNAHRRYALAGSAGTACLLQLICSCHVLNHAVVQGKRIVAFVVGGVTRSEMRVAHKLSAKLGREILIGSTSCDTPTSFLKSLQVQCHLNVTHQGTNSLLVSRSPQGCQH